MKSPLLVLLFACLGISLTAQVSKDASVPLTAVVSTNPASITLSWPNPSASALVVRRRTKGQAGDQWTQLLNTTGSTQNTLIDNAVVAGQTYEYYISRTSNLVAFGYAQVALQAPVTDSRGKILVFIDSTTADALGVELVRLKNDMRGDGWIATPYKVGPASTPQSVKNQIIAAYNADPGQVKAVFLIGRVPVPYSGNSSWDGHGDHAGAWPCDNYYADVNGVWTDVSVNNTSPGRDANDNVPGDGKFDQSIMPSAAEMQVGRLDFHRLDPGLFGASEIALLRRYLDKDHAWRTGAYTVENKALVDDNFGYFGGEAFAANGYRNAYPLVGETNVLAGDFFNDSANQKWLLGYGTGPGSYTSADGVGTSTDFATKTVNIVFSNIFGSYHGDWDYESNPLMPAALASQGGLLTCGWAGRPTWYMQALAAGESIGYCMKETQNAQYNSNYTGSSGRSGAHVALLGDPTLRAHIVPPVSGITIAISCATASIQWTASPDTTISGYHVYRSFSNDGPYTRLTTNVLTTNIFVDNNPPEDTLYYQVRAIRAETTPGGGTYLNNSTSPIQPVIFIPQSAPIAVATSTVITCNNPTATLLAADGGTGATYAWTGPNEFSATQQMTTTTLPGLYTLIVTGENGCTRSTTTPVVEDTAMPQVTIPPIILTCTNTNGFFIVPNLPGYRFYYNGMLLTPGQPIPFSIAGGFEVIMESIATGCKAVITLFVLLDSNIPDAAATGGELNCDHPSVTLQGTTTTPNTLLQWTGPGGFFSTLPNPTTTQPGIYIFQVTNPSNGCTSVATATVTGIATSPIAVSTTVVDESAAGAHNGSIDLSASGGTGGFTYLWSNGATTAVITNLSAGVYTATVTDETGCNAVVSVTVLNTSGTLESDLYQQLQVSPNPTTGPVLLTLALHHSMAVQVAVYDAMGRLVWEQAETSMHTATVPIDLSQAAAGIYTVRIRLDGFMVVRQVALLH